MATAAEDVACVVLQLICPLEISISNCIWTWLTLAVASLTFVCVWSEPPTPGSPSFSRLEVVFPRGFQTWS